MFGCKKENDTVWIESREYYLEVPEWWGDGMLQEQKLRMTNFFHNEGVKILEIETHSERMNRLNRPHISQGIIYFKIYRKDLSVMQEKFEFKVADW